MSSKFPSFSDLGKDCRDLFKNGYHIDLFQVKVRNETCHGVEIKSTATHKTQDKSASADVEVKSSFPGFKWLTTTCKWDLDNNLSKEVTIQNLIPGGKATFGGRFNPETFNKNASLKLKYEHARATVDANASGGDDSSVMAGGSLVSGHCGLVAGYKVDYDTSAGQLTANNLVLGYQTKDYGLLLAYDNLAILNGLYFHRINRDIEVGVQTTMLGGEEGTQLEIAGRYTFSGYGHALRAKINNKSLLGLGLSLKIQEGFQAFASTSIDLKSISAGNHKIGFGLDFGI